MDVEPGQGEPNQSDMNHSGAWGLTAGFRLPGTRRPYNLLPLELGSCGEDDIGASMNQPFVLGGLITRLALCRSARRDPRLAARLKLRTPPRLPLISEVLDLCGPSAGS